MKQAKTVKAVKKVYVADIEGINTVTGEKEVQSVRVKPCRSDDGYIKQSKSIKDFAPARVLSVNVTELVYEMPIDKFFELAELTNDH